MGEGPVVGLNDVVAVVGDRQEVDGQRVAGEPRPGVGLAVRRPLGRATAGRLVDALGRVGVGAARGRVDVGPPRRLEVDHLHLGLRRLAGFVDGRFPLDGEAEGAERADGDAKLPIARLAHRHQRPPDVLAEERLDRRVVGPGGAGDHGERQEQQDQRNPQRSGDLVSTTFVTHRRRSALIGRGVHSNEH